MKRKGIGYTIGLGLAVCTACVGHSPEYAFELKGDLINVDTGTVVLWSPGDTLRQVVATTMKDGKFLLSGTLPEPGKYILDIADSRVSLVLDAPKMALYTDFLSIDTRFLKGSPATKSRLAVEEMLRENYETKVEALLQDYEERTEQGQRPDAALEKQANEKLQEYKVYRSQLILEYVKKHPDDLYMPVFIREQMDGNYNWGKQAYQLLSSRIQASQPGRLLKEHLDVIASTVEGSLFPAFTAENAAGEQVEWTPEPGTVYVVDFWASWCGPCRAEMQHLKELYREYAGQPVCFVSVSLDKRESDWKKADAEEALPWTSLWMKENFKAPLAKQLGIEAIPFIVVVDKAGKIAGKNLRDKALIAQINESLK